MIETLSNFEVSSVRDEEAVRFDSTQNEKEVQVWTQRMTDKKQKEMSELRNGRNEKLEKVMREVKISSRMQFVFLKKITKKLFRK